MSHATQGGFSTAELLLVTKALDGRLRDEEREVAKALGHEIGRLRAASTAQVLRQNERLMENLSG